jgi:hypothetical protein
LTAAPEATAGHSMRLVSQLSRGQFVQRAVSKHGVAVAMILALLGVALTIYMIVAVAQPTNMLPSPMGVDHGRFKETLFRR